ncbi:MAG: peptidoglycan DD-metalloendopeptidase family protein [Magnetococcus sp. DMHC-6]
MHFNTTKQQALSTTKIKTTFRVTKRPQKRTMFFSLVVPFSIVALIAVQRAPDAHTNLPMPSPVLMDDDSSTYPEENTLTLIPTNPLPERFTADVPDSLTSLESSRSLGLRMASLSNKPIAKQNSENDLRVVTDKINKGDTFSHVLQRHDIPMTVVNKIATAAKPIFNLVRKLQVNHKVYLNYDSTGQLTTFFYEISDTQTLRIDTSKNNQFSATLKNVSIDSLTSEASTQPSNLKLAEKTPDVSKETDSQKAAQANSAPQDPYAKKIFKKANRIILEKVRDGDSLASLMERNQVPNQTSVKVAKAAKPVFDLARQLLPGRDVRLAFNESDEFQGLSYPIDDTQILWISGSDNNKKYEVQVEKKQFEIRANTISGIINDSLFLAGRKAGLTLSQAVELAKLFEWDVDFARDIRAGDRFTVVYEEKYHNGKFSSRGNILAAEFINQGHHYRAIRYVNPSGEVGYYDDDGYNIEKMFIRAPVDFTRISSVFSKNRLHPIFGYTRAHKGVDYAAPTGTPVRASANGRVIFKGDKSGYGNMIVIHHNDTYTTAYAHLSSYAKNLHEGSTVQQGQVIGKVGMTGAATGPHLHYEVRVNDVQTNPLSAQLPISQPVDKRYLSDFKKKSSKLLALLDRKPTTVAALVLPQE